MSEVKIMKKNRILHVSEGRLDSFLNQGYDQIDEEGNVIKRATGGRMVSLAEHNQVLEENDRLTAEIKKLKAEITKLKKSD